MTEYRCLVLDKNGQRNWQRLDAESEAACLDALMRQNLVPLRITDGPMDLTERLSQPVNIRFGAGRAQAMELRQLATLVSAGLPVDRSLDLLRDQLADKRQRQRHERLLSDVRSGSSLGEAMQGLGGYPQWALGIIKAAQAGGRIGDALVAVADRMESEEAIRRRLVTSLTYPAAVMIATIAALIIVLTLVVPQFAPIFEGEEERLPNLTRAVLALSDAVQSHGWTLLAGLCGLVLLLVLLFRASNQNNGILAKIRWPGQRLFDQYLAAQFTGLLSTLLLNGVTLIKALPLARDAMSSARWRNALSLVEQQIREGARLSQSLAQVSFFPVTAARLIEVGEATGKLGETAHEASKVMGTSATARIERIVALANPIAIILLGGIVALLVAGVMLGIFSLGDFAG